MRELFERLLPIFLENGGELFSFHDMTYKEIMLIIEANRRRVRQNFQMQASIAYQTTRLNSYALNDPSAMPPIQEIFPSLFDDVIQKPKESPQSWMMLRDSFMAYAEKHNASRKQDIEGGGV